MGSKRNVVDKVRAAIEGYKLDERRKKKRRAATKMLLKTHMNVDKIHTGTLGLVARARGDALGILAAPDMATDTAIRTKTLCDKWVNAINQQLRLKVENQTEKLEKRIRELEEKLKEK